MTRQSLHFVSPSGVSLVLQRVLRPTPFPPERSFEPAKLELSLIYSLFESSPIYVCVHATKKCSEKRSELYGKTWVIARKREEQLEWLSYRKPSQRLTAAGGFEPPNRDIADLRLSLHITGATPWLFPDRDVPHEAIEEMKR